MQHKKPSQEPNPDRKAARLRAVAKYSGMAFQLLAACLVGVFLGRWLDKIAGVERPTWAVFLTVFFMLGSLYALYRQLLNDK